MANTETAEEKAQAAAAAQAQKDAEDAAKAQEQVAKERGPIDRVTNQPLSDFVPQSEDDKDEANIAALTLAAQSSGRRPDRNFTRLNDMRAADEAARVRKEEADKLLAELTKQTKEMAKEASLPYEVYLARERARVEAEAAANTMNTIRPGGEFIVEGVRVNAWGVPL